MSLSEKTKKGMRPFVRRCISPLRKVVNTVGEDKIQYLSPAQRKVVELRLQNLTLEQVGDKLGITKQVAGDTEKRAIRNLEVMVEESKLMW